MKEVFKRNNLIITDDKFEEYKKFCSYLLENNKKFNITAIRDEEGVFEKHFADSLMGAEFFEEEKPILEIGSGGGFPSVPLKIFNRNFNFTLMEATGKKCQFLKGVKELFSFDNFDVINGRAEEEGKEDLRESFSFVTARAVASLNVLSELALPFIKVGGKAIFYKNYSEEEIEKGKSAIKKLGGKICHIKKYKLFSSPDERCIIVIEKKESTPEKYPREYKKIIKSPL